MERLSTHCNVITDVRIKTAQTVTVIYSLLFFSDFVFKINVHYNSALRSGALYADIALDELTSPPTYCYQINSAIPRGHGYF